MGERTMPLEITRRRFIGCGAACSGLALFGSDFYENEALAAESFMQARFYTARPNGLVVCHVCPRECVIAEDKRGICGTRLNQGGVLYSLVYGRVAAEALDPIEKKPFFHVLPGSRAYSIATAGCNMTCKFCQNYTLSQSKPEDLRSVRRTPTDIASLAANGGAASIAYTYNEPTVFTEYVHDCARAGQKHGIASVVVSNGYINAEPLDRLAEVIDAYKVDFKAFSRSFYREITGGERDPVLETIKRLKKHGIWTELVHLTIPTLNDADADFAGMADWLMGELGPDIPVHFTRFHPTYRLTNLPVTPLSTLVRARSILLDKGMNFVYVGNVPGHPGESTWCPSCGKVVIGRRGYTITALNLKNGMCTSCKTRIPGVWSYGQG